MGSRSPSGSPLIINIVSIPSFFQGPYIFNLTNEHTPFTIILPLCYNSLGFRFNTHVQE